MSRGSLTVVEVAYGGCRKREGGCQWSGEESTVVRGGMKRKKYKEEE